MSYSRCQYEKKMQNSNLLVHLLLILPLNNNVGKTSRLSVIICLSEISYRRKSCIVDLEGSKPILSYTHPSGKYFQNY